MYFGFTVVFSYLLFSFSYTLTLGSKNFFVLHLSFILGLVLVVTFGSMYDGMITLKTLVALVLNKSDSLVKAEQCWSWRRCSG